MHVPQRGLPVTIVTGFLGSGKTTLLNHILTNQQGLRTAVMVNEFGEIGIDAELIVSSDEDLVELNNGCMCCTVRDDIVDSVLRLLEKAENLDYLVVETTGLADPLPVALTFLGPELRDLTRLDSIVTMVDATNFAPDLFNTDVAHNQILYGDVVLLNKTDLVAEAELVRLEKRLRGIKEGARLLRTVKGVVPLELILDTDLFKVSSVAAEEEHEAHEHEGHDHAAHAHDAHDHETHDHGAHHHEAHGHSHHDHAGHDHDHAGHDHELETHGFNSLSFTSDRPFSLDKFQDFLNNLPAAVFRAKGMLWFQESAERHVFHLSGKRYTVNSEPWPDDQPPQTRLVVIGQQLDLRSLRRQLEQCLVQPASVKKGFR